MGHLQWRLPNPPPFYVTRPCDALASQQLQRHRCVHIHGDAQVGKRALVQSIFSTDLSDAQRVVLYLDFAQHQSSLRLFSEAMCQIHDRPEPPWEQIRASPYALAANLIDR